MSEINHTPLPWVSKGRYIGTKNHMSYVGEVRDQNGNWSDTEKSRGDAAFIVEACNSYYLNRAALAAKDAEITALKSALRPFADVADFFDSETEGFCMEDTLQLVIENDAFPKYHVNSFCLERFYAARAALQPDAKSGGREDV